MSYPYDENKKVFNLESNNLRYLTTELLESVSGVFKRIF